MARICMSLFLLFVCSLGVVHGFGDEKVSDYWCIARADAPDDKLQGLLDNLCGMEDCSAIQPGGPCFEPNTVRNHASYALNLHFRTMPACNYQYATVTSVDPSYGNCHYQGYTG